MKADTGQLKGGLASIKMSRESVMEREACRLKLRVGELFSLNLTNQFNFQLKLRGVRKGVVGFKIYFYACNKLNLLARQPNFNFEGAPCSKIN